MIDKSFENSNYPPFMTIVRGEITTIWGVISRNKNNYLIVDI